MTTVNEHLAEKCEGIAVHGIQRDGSLNRIAEALNFLMEKESLREGEIGEMTGWRSFHGPSCRRQTGHERISLKIEPVRIVLDTKERQHCPRIAIRGRLPHGSFQARASWNEFPWRRTLRVAEAAQHRLIGG